MRSMPLVAVLQFPGSNCEYETARAVAGAGMDPRIFRWNQTRELRDADPDAYVIPGGFSFQDRVRAGAVAAKEIVMDIVFDASGGGRPVLGICNGAQILVESGMVPGLKRGSVESSLASNHVSGRSGYLSRWVFLRSATEAGKACPWLSGMGCDPLPLPIAHAEGRFVFREGDDRTADEAAALLYCDENGLESPRYPVNPNGSVRNLAGIMNPGGNVLAMMPHPERALWLRQLPPWMPGEWGDRRREAAAGDVTRCCDGPGAVFFESLARHFQVVGRDV